MEGDAKQQMRKNVVQLKEMTKASYKNMWDFFYQLKQTNRGIKQRKKKEQMITNVQRSQVDELHSLDNPSRSSFFNGGATTDDLLIDEFYL